MDATWVIGSLRRAMGSLFEIQALWYNTLCVMQDIARAPFGDEVNNHRYEAMAALTSESFNRLFWNGKDWVSLRCCPWRLAGYCRRPAEPDLCHPSPLPMLNPARANRVLDVVQEHLLTPFGLRTLAPSDPQYRGRYTGDQASRDGAYHQGTVWPWLMGPFLTAYIKVHGRSEPARRQAESWLSAFKDQLSDSGLGQVSEIFEGDESHGPVGCHCASMERGRTAACHGGRCLSHHSRSANLVRSGGFAGLMA